MFTPARILPNAEETSVRPSPEVDRETGGREKGREGERD